jgi:hypothetical protein
LDLETKLSSIFNKKVEVTLKDNRTTFLRTKFFKTHLQLMLHKSFADAPDIIFFHLKEFLINKKKESLKIVRNFFLQFLEKKDFSSCLKVDKLKSTGKVYDLKKILDHVNETYFQKKEELFISFSRKRKNRRRILFGSYNRGLKLITINEILDDDFFPLFFVSYVIYHEALHHYCPVTIGSNGNRRVHGKEFKELEKKYSFYKEAKAFEKQFLKKGKCHGWT